MPRCRCRCGFGLPECSALAWRGIHTRACWCTCSLHSRERRTSACRVLHDACSTDACCSSVAATPTLASSKTICMRACTCVLARVCVRARSCARACACAVGGQGKGRRLLIRLDADFVSEEQPSEPEHNGHAAAKPHIRRTAAARTRHKRKRGRAMPAYPKHETLR